jgi:hypothetical protein
MNESECNEGYQTAHPGHLNEVRAIKVFGLYLLRETVLGWRDIPKHHCCYGTHSPTDLRNLPLLTTCTLLFDRLNRVRAWHSVAPMCETILCQIRLGHPTRQRIPGY